MSKKSKKEIAIIALSGSGAFLLFVGLGIGSYWLYVWGDFNFDSFARKDLWTLTQSIIGLLLGPIFLFKAYKLLRSRQ